MKKGFLAVFSVIVVGYITFWSVTATHLKLKTEAALNDLNNLDGVSFQYGSVSIDEFPWHFGVTIRGAKLSFNGQSYLQLLHKINPNRLISAESIKKISALHTVLEFRDEIRLSSNLLAKNFTLHVGKLVSHSSEPSGQLSVTQKGESILTVKLKQGMLFSLLFSSSTGTSLNDLREIAFNSSATQYFVEGKAVASTGHGSLFLSRQKVSKHLDDYRVRASYQDVKIRDLMTLYFQHLPSYVSLFKTIDLDPKLYDTAKPANMSFDIQVKMTPLPKLIQWYQLGDRGKDYIKNAFQQTPPVFAINSFKVDNDFYHVDLTLHNKLNKKMGSDRVQCHAKFQLSDRGQAFFAHAFSRGFHQAFQQTEAPLNSDAFKKLMPNLAEKGLIKLDMDYENLADHSTNVIQCKVACDHYSAAFSGKIGPNTALNVMASIHNYQPFVQDLFSYTNQVLLVLEQDKRFTLSVHFADDFLHQVEQFIRKASDDPKSTSPDTQITFNIDNAQLHVGTLSTAEVINEVGRLYDMVTIVKNKNPGVVFNQKVKPHLNAADDFLQHGFRFDLGHGTAIDYKEAMTWYKKVIDLNGDARALNNAAVLLAQGRGVDKNVTMAMTYFRQAAKHSPVARINLKNLTNQRGYPALIRFSGLYSHSVVCQQYDQQSIRNMLDVIAMVGWREITLIPPGQPDAIPKALRAYTIQYAEQKGIRVHG